MDNQSFRVPSSLRQLLIPVLQEKYLKDDHLWKNDILPQLLSLFNTVSTPPPESSNKDATVIASIQDTVAAITKRLKTGFSDTAPFTVHRLTELLLSPGDSGYSSSSSKQTLKYLHAILRVVSVSSSETRYFRHHVVSQSPNLFVHESQVSPEVYESNDLPTNVCFVPLGWDDKHMKHGLENGATENGKKRCKSDAAPNTEAIDFSETSTSSTSDATSSCEKESTMDMPKLGSYSSSDVAVHENSDNLDKQDDSASLKPHSTDKLSESTTESNYPVQLLSPLNTDKAVDPDVQPSEFEDNSMRYETPSKKHNEELRV